MYYPDTPSFYKNRLDGEKYYLNLYKQQPVGLEQITDKIQDHNKWQSNWFCNKKINKPIKLIKTLKPVQFKVFTYR